MLDLIFLAAPILLGWGISFSILEPLAGIEEQRWNHFLTAGDPRRFRAPQLECLNDISLFEWTWDNLKARADENNKGAPSWDPYSKHAATADEKKN